MEPNGFAEYSFVRKVFDIEVARAGTGKFLITIKKTGKVTKYIIKAGATQKVLLD